MIATHNIKVNGKWYHAGEKVPEKAVKAEKKEAPAETKPVEPVAATEETKAEAPVAKKVEPYPHNAGRRKNGK